MLLSRNPNDASNINSFLLKEAGAGGGMTVSGTMTCTSTDYPGEAHTSRIAICYVFQLAPLIQIVSFEPS